MDVEALIGATLREAGYGPETSETRVRVHFLQREMGQVAGQFTHAFLPAGPEPRVARDATK